MSKTNKAQVGDVIRSEAFAFGTFDFPLDLKTRTLAVDRKKITVDGKTRQHLTNVRHKGRDSYEQVDIGAYDPSRGKALFVVEYAEKEGGQEGNRMNNHEFFPDGWLVRARRLNSDRTYNPNGELISFYQTGSFLCMVPEVELVDHVELNQDRKRQDE